MRLIKPSVEVFKPVNQNDILKHLETVARICYKSEERITETSANDFIAGIIRRGHEAMIEHYHFVFGTKKRLIIEALLSLDHDCVKFINITNDGIISGNARAFRNIYKANRGSNAIRAILVAMNEICPVLFSDLDLGHEKARREDFEFIPLEAIRNLTEESRRIHQYITAKFICDRGVTHELVRHRAASYAQESTRFCCYTKEKFGDEVSFILPCWFKEDWPEKIELEDDILGTLFTDSIEYNWVMAMLYAENSYKNMIVSGWTPQQARSVLPNALKTEIIITANLNEIDHIINLRGAPEAHPQMREEIDILKSEIKVLLK